ncbi:helicase HerA domain-containing protein [Halomarina oriensis]|uniref:DUF87 domain-containing protein n=1 Tax=Halomarina oriensis TaxID=671145 RepID=A0A6B0GQS7_9EURY|nr:DUF87 domain-containing protein [Halomarina oriensis]MWG34018.1 DUF87 domain-containing protein [Halomarina oriensis]
MGETETITVAEVSDGVGSVGTLGTDVSLPSVEVLTGRGFVTGKSGSGKSNTASVVIEKLLDRGFPVLIVDIDGEYYGLKEKYEILHVGDDEECDIRVSAEHAEKIADLALVQNVPIILDVSSFLDEREAADLLTEVAKQLFAKEKKLKKPFLLVVEEVHEWIPEGGGMGECGRMLIKVGKRGRKHGLGIMGISQRPADVKKDFITQCDWLCWHRLTWRNDTKVVKRVLGSEYSEAVESLADGEAFLVTDWEEEVRRVQFQRKTTFDAGATPGLDDFERPDLKSVSEDLVGELTSITDEQNAREDRIEELEAELRRKESRIEVLERDLEDARDLSRMADQFAAALFDHPGQSRMALQRRREDAEQATLGEAAEGPVAPTASDGPPTDERPETATSDAPDESDENPPAPATPWPMPEAHDPAMSGGDAEPSVEAQRAADDDPIPGPESGQRATSTESVPDSGVGSAPADLPRTTEPAATDDWADAGITLASDDTGDGAEREGTGRTPWPDAADGRGDSPSAPDTAVAADDESTVAAVTADRPVVERVRTVLTDLDPTARAMLGVYRAEGPCSPLDAHVAAGGDGERTTAYSLNSELREAGLIRHAGRGQYAYALPTFVAAAHGDRLDDDSAGRVVERIETGLLD